MRTLALRVTAAAFVLALSAAPVWAQPSPTARRWQVEGFAGLSLFDLPSDGTFTLPPAGPPLTTSGPVNQSRRVSTWFLGDGAQLLNGVNAEFAIPQRITPLDAALAAVGVTGSNAPAFGLRLRRVLTSKLTIEFSADLMPGSREVSPELVEAVESARASFITAFTGLLTTGPFTSAAVTATGGVTNQASRDLATTVAIQWTFPMGSTNPYISVGGGLVHQLGDLPSASLSGNYQFSFEGVPFNETDTLRLRFDQGTALVGLVGAGIRRTLGDRYGLSLDARLLLGQQTLTMRLDSSPAVATGTPAGVIESFTTPAIQFSNNASTGRESTLSGEPLNGFKVFSTDGLQTRYVVTVGMFLRF